MIDYTKLSYHEVHERIEELRDIINNIPEVKEYMKLIRLRYEIDMGKFSND